jgi:hypothetical protein
MRTDEKTNRTKLIGEFLQILVVTAPKRNSVNTVSKTYLVLVIIESIGIQKYFPFVLWRYEKWPLTLEEHSLQVTENKC